MLFFCCLLCGGKGHYQWMCFEIMNTQRCTKFDFQFSAMKHEKCFDCVAALYCWRIHPPAQLMFVIKSSTFWYWHGPNYFEPGIHQHWQRGSVLWKLFQLVFHLVIPLWWVCEPLFQALKKNLFCPVTFNWEAMLEFLVVRTHRDSISILPCTLSTHKQTNMMNC